MLLAMCCVSTIYTCVLLILVVGMLYSMWCIHVFTLQPNKLVACAVVLVAVNVCDVYNNIYIDMFARACVCVHIRNFFTRTRTSHSFVWISSVFVQDINSEFLFCLPVHSSCLLQSKLNNTVNQFVEIVCRRVRYVAYIHTHIQAVGQSFEPIFFFWRSDSKFSN